VKKTTMTEPHPFDGCLADVPSAVQPVLLEVLATIRRAAPDAEEKISYRMPSFHRNGVLAYVGAFKHHIGFYPPVNDPVLRKAAAAYAGEKGNLQFPLDAPMPLALIERIVRSRVRENEAKATKPPRKRA
jgi:uncharacterized protein YdhG (YjbR/CyaY superfamily)